MKYQSRRPAPAAPPDAEHFSWDTPLLEVLAGEGLHTVFQPIVDLFRRTVAGYEALSRFEHPRMKATADHWFGAAALRGLSADLNAAALRSAMQHRDSLPDDCFLSLNVDPRSLLSPAVQAEFEATGNLGGVVIEITEHFPWDYQDIAAIVEQLRRSGAQVAVDDAGSGYAGLGRILELRPSVLKLDRSLIKGIDHDDTKVALVEMVGLFASRIDASLLAEGVESISEARRLHAMGVPLAQGYIFGRPAEPWAAMDQFAASNLADLTDCPTGGLHRLLRVTPSARNDDPAGAAKLLREEEWVVVIDGDERPRGLLDRFSADSGELVQALRVNVASAPSEVASRMAAGQVDPNIPVLVTDNSGRYLGTIGVNDLLGALAHTDQGAA